MALLRTDSIALSYASLPAGTKWWIDVFECKQTKRPPLDDLLPSDVALKLPGHDLPSIFLSDRGEELQAGFERTNERQIIFTDKLAKVHEYLASRGASPGPIQDERGTHFFELRDPEGNVIEICFEP